MVGLLTMRRRLRGPRASCWAFEYEWSGGPTGTPPFRFPGSSPRVLARAVRAAPLYVDPAIAGGESSAPVPVQGTADPHAAVPQDTYSGLVSPTPTNCGHRRVAAPPPLPLGKAHALRRLAPAVGACPLALGQLLCLVKPGGPAYPPATMA